jgi:hypothetical protein
MCIVSTHESRKFVVAHSIWYRLEVDSAVGFRMEDQTLISLSFNVLILDYFPRVGLCNLYAVYVSVYPPYQLLNA